MSIYLWFLDFATVYSYFNIQLCSFFIVENNCFFKKWVFLFIGRGYISRGELSAPKFLGVCFAHNGRGEEGGGGGWRIWIFWGGGGGGGGGLTDLDFFWGERGRGWGHYFRREGLMSWRTLWVRGLKVWSKWLGTWIFSI